VVEVAMDLTRAGAAAGGPNGTNPSLCARSSARARPPVSYGTPLGVRALVGSRGAQAGKTENCQVVPYLHARAADFIAQQQQAIDRSIDQSIDR